MKVTCNGCFDGLHPGHFFLLGYCYSLTQNGQLVVGINSDNYIRDHKREEPYFNEQERRQTLIDLQVVSHVEIFNEENACDFICRVMPDIHCIGEEYKGKCPEETLCQQLGIEVSYIPRVGRWSTSKIGKFAQA